MHVFPFLSLSQKKVTHWQSCENLQYFHCIFYIFQTHQSTFYMFKINMLSKKHEKFSVIFLSFNFTLKGKIIILEKNIQLFSSTYFSSENISLFLLISYGLSLIEAWHEIFVVGSNLFSPLHFAKKKKKCQGEGNKTVLQKHPI